MNHAEDAQRSQQRAALWWPGLIALIVAAGASLAMSAEHLWGVKPPGCGPGGGCAAASRSVWAAIPTPWGAWPVAFIGLAYFTTMLVEWLASRDEPARGPRWIVRFGALASIGYIIVMIAGGYLCPYCLATHAGNLTFCIVMEIRLRRAPGVQAPMVVPATVTFALASIVIGLGFARHQTTIRAAAERERQASVAEIIDKSSDHSEVSIESPSGPGRSFTGRWRLGREAAPIRIVVFSDYQCTDCRRIETELRKLLADRGNVSLSAKHFPFCRPCNPNLETDVHPNACWAALAAETAGILRGNDGFWAMHHWLFDRGGGFTNAELNAHLIDQGYDVGQFTKLMKSDDVLAPIQAEVEEGMALGLHYTPMIFINGVEMKGITIPSAVTSTVGELARRNLPPLTAAADRPPLAVQKYVDDWREQLAMPMPAVDSPHVIGAAEPAVTIVLWGDYQERNTALADARIRGIVSARDDVRYQFRHFPFDQSCNPHAPRTEHARACLAVRAAEAAGHIGGDEAFWNLHRWLLEHQDELDESSILRGAEEWSISGESLRAAMSLPSIDQAIASDAQAARTLGIQAIPMIYINNRFVPRWDLKGERVLEQIVQSAAR